MCLAVRAFALVHDWTNVIIHIRSDNAATVSYINRMSGHNPELSLMSEKLWRWVLDRGITLECSHIPGRVNVRSDRLSRWENDFTDWTLSSSVFSLLDRSSWGPHTLDAFATANAAEPSHSSLRVISTGGGGGVGGLISAHVGFGESICEPTVLPSEEGNGKDPEGSGHGDAAVSSVARPTMVACSAQKLMRLAKAASEARGEFCTSMSRVVCQDHEAILAGDRSLFVRGAAQSAGISTTAVKQILGRWQDSAKRHDRPFRLFLAFCKKTGKCGICEVEPMLVNYASACLIEGFSGADFRAHMGALKQWLLLLVPLIRQSVWVANLEASVRVSHPDRAKYANFYRLDKIWTMLREWGPTESLLLKQLRTRALMLLCIDLVARSADIGWIQHGLV